MVTRYAIETDRGELIAAWSSGGGDRARRVAELPKERGDEELLRLSLTMTRLADAAWRTYTHPASAADSWQPNTEGWRRQQERASFEEAVSAVRTPHLPEDGSLLVSYSPLVESGHQLGRVLHDLADERLREAVIAEVTEEFGAIEQAERGHLTGRARQAVSLNREDASPLQVAAADELLDTDPSGSTALFTEIDPTAAAVAAAHWLQAAADVAAQSSGLDPTTVIEEADNIEALPHQTPTHVLELMSEGHSPREVVTTLVRQAMQTAQGIVPDPEALVEDIQEAEERLQEYEAEDPELASVRFHVRLTPLDPMRPARDLLEDLLSGIHACWLIWDEYAHDAAVGDANDQDEEWTDEQAQEHHSRRLAEFHGLVRTAAAAQKQRLG